MGFQSVLAVPDASRACSDPVVLRTVDELCGGQVPSIDTPAVNLQKGEACFYVTATDHFEMRTVTKRIDYAGVTARVGVMRGVYIRSGSFTPRRVTREELTFQDAGTLYFTNKRMIFMGMKKNVVLTRKSILGVNPMRDAIEIEKTSGRNPVFMNRDYRRAICMNAAASRFMNIDENHLLSRRSL